MEMLPIQIINKNIKNSYAYVGDSLDYKQGNVMAQTHTHTHFKADSFGSLVSTVTAVVVLLSCLNEFLLQRVEIPTNLATLHSCKHSVWLSQSHAVLSSIIYMNNKK